MGTRLSDKNRRISTILRDNYVLEAYNKGVENLGKFAELVARSYIYDKVSKATGYCTKTVAFIINHCKYSELRE